VARLLMIRLQQLGLQVHTDDYGNVVAFLDGENAAGEPLVLCGHMDTVDVVENGQDEIVVNVGEEKITSDGQTIIGADNKDSVAAILEMVEIIIEKKLKHRPLELVFTREEEAISVGAKKFNFSLLTGKECVISDMSQAYGKVVRSAPYCIQVDVQFEGKECHAKEPEKGVNAFVAACEFVTLLSATEIEASVRMNIAAGIGGVKDFSSKSDISIESISKANRNTVPGMGNVFIQLRGLVNEHGDKTVEQIQEVSQKVAEKFGCKVVVNVNKLADCYVLDEQGNLMLKIFDVFRAQGVEPSYFDSNGGSDANIFNNMGIETAVISSAHRNNHQVTEYVIIEDLVKLADFYLRLVTKVD